MAVVKELLRAEDDGTISFGDYTLQTKKKLSDFAFQGDLYKVKTYDEITRLERNDTLIYESVPGTAVREMKLTDSGVSFTVEGAHDVQITLGMEEGATYDVKLDGRNIGCMETSMGGKLAFGIELENAEQVRVEVIRV